MTELLSAAETARILGVSRGRVLELADTDPAFPAWQPSSAGGRAWPRAAVEAWAAGHPDRGPLHRGPAVPEVGGRSPLVWKVANLAGAEAEALHHTWIGPEHLLAALVHPNCPGAARAVLASLGVTAERLQQARQRSFVDPFEPGSGWKQASPAFQLVLERAHLEAVLLADSEVTSEHVLLALTGLWARQATTTALPDRPGLDPAVVRRRVLDLTEGMAVPPPPEAPEPEPATAMDRVAPGLALAATPDGKDPRRRMPWGSRVFVDAGGRPIKRSDGHALRQYFVDRDGNPVLTTDGRPVHTAFDEQGREVLDGEGRPLIVPVEVPDGATVQAPAASTAGAAAIAIVDYDPTWPDQFEELAAGLRRHLGDAVTGIDHIGSTSVPGLAAKDVIDLQVTVADLAQADRLAPAFERAGLIATHHRHDHRPAGDTSDPGRWEKRLWQSPPGARRANVHVRVAGWPNQRYALLFRDYLRAHPRAAAAYARLKRGLAARFGDDLAAYTDLKDSACDLIIVAAEAWAAQRIPPRVPPPGDARPGPGS